jgi:AraC-like DNA-binding protein
MNQLHLFNPGALQPFVACLRTRNIYVNQYLESHLIPPESVAWGTGQILKQQLYRFFEDVAQSEGIEGLGFLDGDPYPLSGLGPLGDALRRTVTLHDSIDTFARLLPIVAEGNLIRLIIGNKTSWLCCITKDLPRTACIADHSSVLVLREVIRLATHPTWQPEHIKLFTEPLPVGEILPELARCNLEFSQNYTAISFPTDVLHQPLQQESDAVSPLEFIKTETSRVMVVDKLEKFLTTVQRHRQLPSIDEVAEILGMNRIGLFRLLTKEKTNFRQIVERVRFNTAISLLEDSENSIKEISYTLGYAHPGNFNRAFLRMSGVTPGWYRQQKQ